MKSIFTYYILPITFYFLPFTFNSLPYGEGWGGASFAQDPCHIIYVTPTGSGSGTKANPSSLANAFTLVNSTDNQIWLAVGNYTISNELPMISGATLEGGFDPNNNWQKTNSQQSIIYRDAGNMDANPNRIVAVECTGISNFSINDVTIITADATGGTSITTYGIHVSACSNYILARLNVTSGNATDGVDGVAGANGMNGANGSAGQPGDEDGGCCTGGGAGGSGSYPGSNAGGNGGSGGARGTGVCFGIGGTAPDGTAGQTGLGIGAGTGGAGGQGMCGLPFSVGCDQTPASIGADGADGTDGANGADGANGIPAYNAYFIPGDGQNGAQGDHGGGGGGGGGGGSQGCLNTCFTNSNGAGPGGSGGGEGGQGGFGATGGTGGGGSFGIYIDANGGGTYLKDAVLNSGLQGIGGTGGAPGGNGGGSSGGAPQVTGCDIGTGGAGGAGGKGGKGGNGGNGAPGASLPFSENTNGTAVAQSDMKATVEPAIYLLNTGCTYHDINYKTNATGIIQWFFDGGSAPLSATGDSVKTQFTTIGRHSTTLVVDGVPYMFTDFTGIFSDGTPYLPDIAGPDTVCPGSSGTYSANFPSAFTVTGYDWRIYNPATTTPAQTGTSSSFNYLFPSTGKYMLTLQTESQCCGWSKVDTFYIDVVPYLTTDVFVSASVATICDGETSTFFAIPINGGNNPTYLWNVNGTSTGVTTNTFSSSTFNDNDVITCTMTSSYPCPLNSPITSLPFTINVNPLPVVNPCTTSGAYLGANTSFSATASGSATPYTYSWDFGDGGVDTAASPTHLFGGTGIFTYSVSVTDSNGCTGVCTNTVDIIIAPVVYAGFTTIQNITCGSTTVSFSDTSLGLDPNNITLNSWLWDFGDGTTDSTQNPTHTYTASGTFSVSLTASNGVFTDTYFAANAVRVKIVPNANISYITDTVCFPLGAQFFDISSGAVSWLWDFGDGATSTLQNPYHTYNPDSTYLVTLTVMSIDTCPATTSDTIYVLPAPTAGYSLSDTVICSADSIIITDNSNGAVKWNWSFGNGNIDITNLPSAQHYVPGWYPIYLSVENQFGCSDDTIQWIQVLLSPVAQFSMNADSVCSVESLTVSNNSINSVSWDWDFGDGTTDTTYSPPPHYYTDTFTANYPIMLVVESYDGCTDTLIDTATVLLTPFASLSLSNTLICAGDTIAFTDNSTGNVVQWNWDFGDGTSETGNLPTPHEYPDAGNYVVSLSVVNDVGCPDDTILINDSIKVKPQPTALFDPDTTEILFPDNDIVLANQSTTSDGSPITTWLWDFGNGNQDSTNFNATAVYTDSGDYTIVLYAMFENLCIDSYKVDVRVIDIEAIYFCNSFTPNADGINDVFYVYGNNVPELKLYIFNRWGDVIFTSDDRTLAAEGKFAGWDGKVKNVRVEDGIYPFKVEYKLNSTKKKLHIKTGTVMVMSKK